MSRTRALLTAAQCSLEINDLSVTLFLKYMSLSRQIYNAFVWCGSTFGCFPL